MDSAPIGDASLVAQPTPSAPGPRSLGTSIKVAGACTVLNGVATIGILASNPSAGIHGSPIIDFLIGFPLLAGRPGVLPWARCRAWLGLVIGVAMLFFTDWTEALAQTLFSLFLVLLLAENPGRPRLILAGLLGFSFLGLSSVALFAVTPAGARWINSQAGLEELPPGGEISTPYHLRLPSGWGRFNASKTKDLGADLFLANAQTASFLAAFSSAREEGLTLDDMRQSTAEHFKDAKIQSEKKSDDTLRLCFETVVEGQHLRYHQLLSIRGQRVYQISGWYALPVKPDLDQQLDTILDSFSN